MTKGGFVYILASQRNGTLYIGVTANLSRRLYEHKTHAVKGFTDKYSVDKLMWYEACDTIEGAIMREKQLKKWNRTWKVELIEKRNPAWRDLSEDIF